MKNYAVVLALTTFVLIGCQTTETDHAVEVLGKWDMQVGLDDGLLELAEIVDPRGRSSTLRDTIASTVIVEFLEDGTYLYADYAEGTWYMTEDGSMMIFELADRDESSRPTMFALVFSDNGDTLSTPLNGVMDFGSVTLKRRK